MYLCASYLRVGFSLRLHGDTTVDLATDMETVPIHNKLDGNIPTKSMILLCSYEVERTTYLN